MKRLHTLKHCFTQVKNFNQFFNHEKDQIIPGTDKVVVNGGVDLSKKPIWIEAPHLYKKDGKYYLICAEGDTGG